MTAIAQLPVARQSAGQGILLYSGAVLLLTLMDGLIKWLSADYPTQQIVFFRSLIGLLPMLMILVRAGSFAALKTRRLGAHIFRGCISTVATFAFFYAFSVMPLADAYAIGFAAPMFITALSVPLLGEAVGVRRWSAVAVGFVGVLVMLRPTELSGFLSTGAIAAMVGTFCYALSMTLMRRLSRTETNAALVFYGAVLVIGSSAASLSFGWVTPTGWDLMLLVAVGLLGGVASLMMAQSYRVATPSVLAPFEYTGLVWSVMVGYAVWHDLPDEWIWAGSVIVIASGLYILHRETRRQEPISPVSGAADDPVGEGRAG